MIHCIGDSHIVIFSGQPHPRWIESQALAYTDIISEFSTHHLGPGLAYNTPELATKTRFREKTFELLDKLKKGSQIIICLGEIDLRKHLVQQSKSQNIAIENIVGECVYRYVTFIEKIYDKGFKVSVLGIQMTDEEDEKCKAQYHSRYQATKIFNSCLRFYLPDYIPFLDIFNSTVDGYRIIDKYYYSDRIHLKQIALPIIMEQLKGFKE